MGGYRIEEKVRTLGICVLWIDVCLRSAVDFVFVILFWVVDCVFFAAFNVSD